MHTAIFEDTCKYPKSILFFLNNEIDGN